MYVQYPLTTYTQKQTTHKRHYLQWHNIGCLLSFLYEVGLMSTASWWEDIMWAFCSNRSVNKVWKKNKRQRETKRHGHWRIKKQHIKEKGVVCVHGCLPVILFVLGCPCSTHIHTYFYVCSEGHWFCIDDVGAVIYSCWSQGNNVFIWGRQRRRPHSTDITPYGLDWVHAGQSTHFTLHHCTLQINTHTHIHWVTEVLNQIKSSENENIICKKPI